MLDHERQEGSLLTFASAQVEKPFLHNYKNIQSYLDRCIDQFNRDAIFFEIGAFAGQSAKLWIESLEAAFCDSPLVIVDPYSPGSANNQDSYLVMSKMLDVIKNYQSSHFYRLYSDHFFKIANSLKIPYRDRILPFGQISFALIDGDHTPIGEIRDIEGVAPFLAEKAFVVIDDVHVALSQIREKVFNLFPGAGIYLWSHEVSDIQQCYIWKGIEVPKDLVSQDSKLKPW